MREGPEVNQQPLRRGGQRDERGRERERGEGRGKVKKISSYTCG